LSAEDLNQLKRKSLEDLEEPLASLKEDADEMPNDNRGISWSERIKNIQKALNVYKNACDNYAAYFMK
jgi:hypothetical protein